jgi:hypothetical protein
VFRCHCRHGALPPRHVARCDYCSIRTNVLNLRKRFLCYCSRQPATSTRVPLFAEAKVRRRSPLYIAHSPAQRAAGTHHHSPPLRFDTRWAKPVAARYLCHMPTHRRVLTFCDQSVQSPAWPAGSRRRRALGGVAEARRQYRRPRRPRQVTHSGTPLTLTPRPTACAPYSTTPQEGINGRHTRPDRVGYRDSD